MPRLSLIISTYCRPKQVPTLFKSVAQQTRLPDMTLVAKRLPHVIATKER